MQTAPSNSFVLRGSKYKKVQEFARSVYSGKLPVRKYTDQNPVKYVRYSFFVKIINGFQSLNIFAKSSILDV